MKILSKQKKLLAKTEDNLEFSKAYCVCILWADFWELVDKTKKKSTMDRMSVSPQNSYVWTLTPKGWYYKIAPLGDN